MEFSRGKKKEIIYLNKILWTSSSKFKQNKTFYFPRIFKVLSYPSVINYKLRFLKNFQLFETKHYFLAKIKIWNLCVRKKDCELFLKLSNQVKKFVFTKKTNMSICFSKKYNTLVGLLIVHSLYSGEIWYVQNKHLLKRGKDHRNLMLIFMLNHIVNIVSSKVRKPFD